jgi:putative phosphoesterase
MKIAVTSDIHDNAPNLEKCFKFCLENKIENAICCGDITNSDTLKKIASFFKDLYLIRGNMDIYDEDELRLYDNIVYLGRFGVTEIEGRNYGLCHEPGYIKDVNRLCEKNGKVCAAIFYGHTHKPWITKEGQLIINPGTLAGTFSRPSFGVWDTEKIAMELKLIELL